ncbi:hypothetical protein BH10PAT3_BH10PAT3_6370 [soil metagenome]
MFKKLAICVATLLLTLLPLRSVAAAIATTTLSQGVISLTFDDGWKNIHDNGLPLLNKYGIVSTQYLNSEPILGVETDGWTGYMSYNNVKDFTTVAGPGNIANPYAITHEVAWHTQTHADLALATAAAVDTELTIPQAFLTGISKSVLDFKNFATPFGSYTQSVQTKIMAKYRSHRSTDVGYNLKADFVNGGKGAENIKVQNIEDTTTPAQVAAWVTEAQTQKNWLVLVYHVVLLPGEGLPEPGVQNYSVTTTNLELELVNIKNSGLLVKTVDQALDVMQDITPVIPPAVKPGDVNGDTFVNALDLSIISTNWNHAAATKAQGDLNGDTVVNALDLSILSTNWGK